MLNPFDAAYHDLCEDILAIGKIKMIVRKQEQFPSLDISCALI